MKKDLERRISALERKVQRLEKGKQDKNTIEKFANDLRFYKNVKSQSR